MGRDQMHLWVGIKWPCGSGLNDLEGRDQMLSGSGSDVSEVVIKRLDRSGDFSLSIRGFNLIHQGIWAKT